LFPALVFSKKECYRFRYQLTESKRACLNCLSAGVLFFVDFDDREFLAVFFDYNSKKSGVPILRQQ
jgi:hypothetical protein